MKKTKWQRKLKKFSKQGKAVVCSLIIISVLCCLGVFSLTHMYDHVEKTQINSKEAFINQIRPTAIKLNRKYHVPASIIMAQASLESDFGRSQLAANYHNLFGVKAGFLEPKVKLPTKEYVNGEWITVNANFKVYKNWQESLEDHTKLLVNGTSWNSKQYEKVIQAKNYKDAAVALEQAGYATDPNYAGKLVSVIEEYKLYKDDIY